MVVGEILTPRRAFRCETVDVPSFAFGMTFRAMAFFRGVTALLETRFPALLMADAALVGLLFFAVLVLTMPLRGCLFRTVLRAEDEVVAGLRDVEARATGFALEVEGLAALFREVDAAGFRAGDEGARLDGDAGSPAFRAVLT